jgi:hypothetical protein
MKNNKKKYKRGGGINTTGYKENTPTENNLYNIIPNTSNITMKEVDDNIMGASYDANGNLTSMKFMKPEQDYQYPPNTEAVYEVPQYQVAGVADWQNLFGNLPNTPKPTSQVNAQPPAKQVWNTSTGKYENVNSQSSAGNTPINSPVITPSSNSLGTARPQVESGIKKTTPMEVKDPMQTMQENALATTTQFENTNANGEAEQGFQNPQNSKYQFINPYATGFDIPSAAVMLGQGIESGNAFDIGVSGLKLATGLARNVVGGMGAENRRQNVMQDATERYRESLTPGEQYYQDGGQQAPPPSQEEIMQMVAQALQQGAQPEEVLQQLLSMGIPQEVATQLIQGAMQGGQEPQYMEEGGIAKVLTGEYIQEPQDVEDEEVVAEIEAGEFILNSETGKITKALGKTHESGGIVVTAEQLPPNSLIISDHLKLGDNAKYYKDNFELDVKPKDTFAKVLDSFTKKSGLQKLVDEQEDYIKSLEKETKKEKQDETVQLNQRFLQSKIEEIEKKKEPLEKVRMDLFQDVFEKQEAGKKVEKEQMEFQNGGMYNGDLIMEYANKYNISPDRANQIVQEYRNGGKNIPMYQDGKGRFDAWYADAQANGYTGVKDVGAIQTWLAQNNPQLVEDYFVKNRQGMTAKHIDILKQKNPQAFKDLGIDINKASAQLTPEEKFKLQDALSPTLDRNFWLEGFQDQKKDRRFPMQGVTISAPMTGTYDNTIKAPLMPSNPYEAPLVDPYNPPTTTPTEERRDPRTGILLLPDQTPLSPQSLAPALKIDRRFDRVEAMQVTPEASIAELRRQEKAAIDSYSSLPDSQRAAAIAQVQSNTQDKIAQISAQVQGQNVASKLQADTTNAGIQMQEENARGTDLLSYEQRIQTASDKTFQDLNRYYNTLQKNNVGNFNTVNNVNLLNAMYDNYQFTGNGVEQVGDNPYLNYDNNVTPSTTTPKRNPRKRKN